MNNTTFFKQLTFSCLLMTSMNSFAEDSLPPSARIVGGDEVTSKSTYPWIVSIKTANTESHFCGGSLIDEQWVLTAAHCMEGLSADNIIATVGEYDLSSSTETPSTNIDKIIIHPNFNTVTFDNDIALIKLSTPVTNTTIMALSSLETTEFTSVNTITSTAIGWGSTVGFSSGEDVNPIYPDILNEVSLPLLSTTTCGAAIPNFTDNMVCAGDISNGGIDSCQGDSGGPLVVESIEQNETQQIGIVSFGFGCAAPNNPGAYTKVSNYSEWIDLQINAVTSVNNTDYFVADIGEVRVFTITIQNNSESLISPTFSLSNEAEFTLQTIECAGLAADSTCDVSFEYKPDAYQTDKTTLLVETNDDTVADSTIEIEAKGMQIVNPNDITFTENTDVTWYQSNTLPWLLSEDASYLQSPSISDNGATQINAIVSGDWSLKFDWAISSEENYDFLTLFINGIAIQSISGIQDFTSEDYQIAGTNTVITWQYTKDSSLDGGSDVAFLHNARMIEVDQSSTDTATDLPSLEPVVVESTNNSSSGGSLHWWSLFLLMIITTFKQSLFRSSIVSSK